MRNLALLNVFVSAVCTLVPAQDTAIVIDPKHSFRTVSTLLNRLREREKIRTALSDSDSKAYFDSVSTFYTMMGASMSIAIGKLIP